MPHCCYFTALFSDARKNEAGVSRDLLRMVRELIGPIAAFRLAVAVRALPRTRSGKTCRKSISDLARDKDIKVGERATSSTRLIPLVPDIRNG